MLDISNQISPRLLDRVLLAFFVVMYTVGFVGHLWEFTLPLMLTLTPWFLFFMGCIVFIPIIWERRFKVLFWAGASYLLTLSLEILGVQTGLVFGSYHYGETLGLSLAEVPLVIGFNWVLVVLGAILLANRLTNNRPISTLIAGIICVVFDFIMEPLAISPVFDYWQWAQIEVPLQNYLAWFLIAVFMAAVFNWQRLRVTSLVPQIYFLVQLGFFILLRWFMGI